MRPSTSVLATSFYLLIALTLLFGGSGCAARDSKEKNHVANTSIVGHQATYFLKKHYPGARGFGISGNWISYGPGFTDYLLVAPLEAGIYTDSTFSYRLADGHALNDELFYRSTLVITGTSLDIKVVNRKTSETYIHDFYTKALTSH